ncbi:MAG: hypothetical protein ACYSWO_00705 [Planctomycetota bacterium]|jgi:hypothetical protein
MSVTIDGQMLFDEHQFEIEVGSFSRDSIERRMPGLDGVLSIDLGRRGRKIRQKGTLRAKSRMQMNERVNAISALADGDTHTLVEESGETLDNLRMDSFKTDKERTDGVGIVVDYEIVYTQLA